MNRGNGARALVLAVCIGVASCNGSSPNYEAALAAQSSGNLVRAYDAFGRALSELKPGTPEYQNAQRSRRQIAGSIVNGYVSDSQGVYGGDLESASIQSVEEAIRVLDGGSSYDTGIGRIAQTRSTYEAAIEDKRAERERLIATAEDAASTGDYQTVEDAILRLGQLDPTIDAQSFRDAAVNTRFRFAIDDAQQASTDREALDRAYETYLGLEETYPDNGNLERLRVAVAGSARTYAEGIMGRSVSLTNFYEGKLELLEIPFVESDGALIGQFNRMALDHYTNQARAWEATGNFGRAFIEVHKAQLLVGERAELVDQILPLRDQVERALERTVAVYQFASPSTDPDIGGQVASELLSNLSRTLGYGYRVIDRSEELFDRNKQTSAGSSGLLTADFQIAGNISELVINEDKKEYMDSVRVKVGEERRESQAWLAWYNRKLQDPNFNAPAPEKYIIDPIYESRQYRKGESRINGAARSSARIIARATTEVLVSENFSATFDKIDGFNDPVAEANIKVDPIELPTKIQVRRTLAEKIVSDVSGMTLKKFRRRELEIFGNIERHIQRREFAAAYEQLAQAIIYCTGIQDPESKAACDGTIDGLIVQYTEGKRWSHSAQQ